MSSADFEVQIDCGGKISTLSFRYSTVPGGVPVLLGVDSQFTEIGCHVFKTVKPESSEKVTKRRMIEVLEYRKKKRELFYEESEEDSTEYTYDG